MDIIYIISLLSLMIISIGANIKNEKALIDNMNEEEDY